MIDIKNLMVCHLKSVVSLWKSNFPSNYQYSEDIIHERIFLDRDFFEEASFVLLEENEVRGFIVVKINNSDLKEYEKCAWISLLLVDSGHRNKGYGKKLYDEAEKVIRNHGLDKIILGGELNNFFSGIPAPDDLNINFFKKRGFIINFEDHYDLIADVSQRDFSRISIPYNNESCYYIKTYEEGDFEKLNNFFHKSFPGRWEQEVMGYIENHGDYRNIILLWENEDILGFCKVYTSDSLSKYDFNYGSHWGSLGPVGIDKKIRGKFLGNNLLREALINLKSRDTNNVLIDWTILKDFYGQFGFKPYRVYRGAYKFMYNLRSNAMSKEEILEKIKHGLIVSCQALEKEPLHGSFIMARMALAAEEGGAVGIRANTIEDIEEIKTYVKLPLIGIIKEDYDNSEVYISPTLKEIKKLTFSSADIIAFDATFRERPDKSSTLDIIKMIHESGKLAMADISTLDEGLEAATLGADIISTTLSGYTSYSPAINGPDFELLKVLTKKLDIPVIAEGRVKTSEDLVNCFKCGAFSVVIGGAITRPQNITKEFVEAIKRG